MTMSTCLAKQVDIFAFIGYSDSIEKEFSDVLLECCIHDGVCSNSYHFSIRMARGRTKTTFSCNLACAIDHNRYSFELDLADHSYDSSNLFCLPLVRTGVGRMIEVFLYKEEDGKIYVSHGVDLRTGKTVILPNEPWSNFRYNCLDLNGSWYLKPNKEH
jgi:hypothetical protein